MGPTCSKTPAPCPTRSSAASTPAGGKPRTPASSKRWGLRVGSLCASSTGPDSWVPRATLPAPPTSPASSATGPTSALPPQPLCVGSRSPPRLPLPSPPWLQKPWLTLQCRPALRACVAAAAQPVPLALPPIRPPTTQLPMASVWCAVSLPCTGAAAVNGRCTTLQRAAPSLRTGTTRCQTTRPLSAGPVWRVGHPVLACLQPLLVPLFPTTTTAAAEVPGRPGRPGLQLPGLPRRPGRPGQAVGRLTTRTNESTGAGRRRPWQTLFSSRSLRGPRTCSTPSTVTSRR